MLKIASNVIEAAVHIRNKDVKIELKTRVVWKSSLTFLSFSHIGLNYSTCVQLGT